MNSLLKIKQHCRWALAAALGLWSSAGAAGLDLQFIGGTNPSTGAACSLTLDSRCRFNNVVVGADGTSYQRDIIVTVTKLTNATLTTAFDNASPPLQGTQTPRATASQFFAPTVQPPQNVANTIGWAEFTFDVVPSGGAVPTVGGGTAALPGTFWVSSFDTDGDNSALREFVEYLSPNATGLSPNTTLTASTAVNGGTQFQGNVASQTNVSTDDPYKATALYNSPRTFKLVYGARIGGAATNTGGRLTAFDFFRPDGVVAQSIVEGYKSVQLTTDADSSGSVSPGDTVTYSVVYVNTGNAAANNFQITDTLPSGLTLLSAGAQSVYVNGTLTSSARNAGYTGTSANNALLASGQSLAADGTVRVDIPATVTQTTAGNISNQASASTTSSGTLLAQTEAADSTTVFPPTVTGAAGWRTISGTSVAQTGLTSAQDPTVLSVTVPPVSLSITKTDNGATFYTGSTATYTVTVTNTAAGSTSSGAINVRDALPSGLTFNSVAVSGGVGGTISNASAANTGGTVGWDFTPSSAMTQGQSATFILTVNVGAATPTGTNSITNYASVGGGGGSAAPTPSSTCTTQCGSDSTTVASAPTGTNPPARNQTAFPAVCDVVDWSKSGITGTAVGQSGTKTFNSGKGLGLTVGLIPATSSGNGIVGLNTGFTNYGSWYAVRAVSTSMANGSAPNYGGAFVTRAGGDSQTNTITITFPHPVINVRFGITDLDAVYASNADQGDWIRVTAGYGGSTFNPDTLIAHGHALVVKGYTTSGTGIPGTAASGASMTVAVPGRGNSSMGAGSTSNVYNTLMGTDTVYGAQVTDPDVAGSTPVNRQGQGVAYFKGPLTTLTIVTGSKNTGSGKAIAFGNIDFCSPSMAVSKAVGTPSLQIGDGSYNIPYTLTYQNTSYNQGLFPDATVRDNPFQPSFATPSGLDPWADLKPQLSDDVVPQLLANSNIQSATVTGSPRVTFANAVGTRNLDSTDVNPSFDGTAGNPTLMTSGTDARVSAGGAFDAKFTVNAVIKAGVTAQQTVSNRASASGSLNTASATLSASSATVSATLTPAVKLTLSKTVDQSYVKYLGDPVTPNFAELNYTIRVTNPDTATAASGVVITDTLPAQVSYVSSSPAASVSGQTLTWSVGTVAAGGSTTVTVKVKVPLASAVEAGQPQASWTNTASAAGSNTVTASGSAKTDTVYTKLFKQVHNLGTSPAAPVPQLSPAWSSSVQGLPGDVLEYCIDFRNYGSTTLTNYVVSDTVPTNTTVVANSWVLNSDVMSSGVLTPYSGGSVNFSGGTVRGTVGLLAPGGKGSMCFRVRINY